MDDSDITKKPKLENKDVAHKAGKVILSLIPGIGGVAQKNNILNYDGNV